MPNPRWPSPTPTAAWPSPRPARVVPRCPTFWPPAELQALADRWTVVGLLQAGMPYREIAQQTGVSVTTIGRVARYLGAGNGGYELAARRLGER